LYLIQLPLITIQIAISVGLLIWILEVERYKSVRFRQKTKLKEMHDHLTELPQRELFISQLADKVSGIETRENHIIVMYVALDRFRKINTSLGRETADALLRKLAKRTRQFAGQDGLSGRIVSDEFVIARLISPDYDLQQISELSSELLKLISQPIKAGEQMISLEASIGLSIFPEDGTQAQPLLKLADIAAQRVKSEGGSNFSFYNKDIDHTTEESYQLETELLKTLQLNQLNLYYQPIVEIDDGKIIGAEALLRWHHPELGLMTPDKFLPIARESAFMRELDQWVLKTATEQISQLSRYFKDSFWLSVNISPNSFQHRQFTDQVATCSSKLPDELTLKIEITEETALSDLEHANIQIEQLSNMGVGVAMDDFGTGYSSLSQLQKMPTTVIKIDRSFMNYGEDSDARIILDAVVPMLHQLGRLVVAEGIETAAQMKHAKKIGIKLAQGYFFYRPMPIEHLQKLLKYG